MEISFYFHFRFCRFRFISVRSGGPGNGKKMESEMVDFIGFHWPGANGQSYAYGHRVDGNSDGDFTDSLDWGTVMSYSDISPDYFSNPNVICKNNSACGVLNQSDNSKWYNS